MTAPCPSLILMYRAIRENSTTVVIKAPNVESPAVQGGATEAALPLSC
jgi:hypothetical protein